ncbi:MAG: SagB/ThcOx family dehydrogenase, partial [Alphaproteobacteria bacterium]|nr:SagB/ThcOx family dehydrogenase [Alphaproteobacteria bacterium]
MQINPNLFFILKEGNIVAWDYKNHQQFVLTPLYFERLLLWSQTQDHLMTAIDEELISGQLLINSSIPVECWGWDVLAQIYHIGTKDIGGHLASLDPKQWTKQYLDHCNKMSKETVDLFTYKEGPMITLPSPNFDLFNNKTFLEALQNRKTCRSFNGKSINLDTLSTLLFTSLGPLHGDWTDLKDHQLSELGIRKAFPSGGGLHPEEGYIVALAVEGLEKGVYHYRFHEHKL